jgi:hypothetical protein
MSPEEELEEKVKMYFATHEAMEGLPHMGDDCKKLTKVKKRLSIWFIANKEPGFLKKIQKERKMLKNRSEKNNKTSDNKNKTSDNKSKTSDNKNNMSDKEEDDNYETEVATLAFIPDNQNWFLEEYMNYEAGRLSPMVSVHNLQATWHDGPQA